MSNYTKETLLIGPGAGEKSGTHLVTKVHASQLNNEFSVMEGIMKPRSLLTPHTHQREDQVVVVLTGALEFEVGGEDGERFRAPAGSYVLKPRGIEHSFWNDTDEDVRYIELSSGAGFQGFIDDSSEHGTIEAARRAEDVFDIDWGYERIPKMMAKYRLTNIAGVEMPWEQLQKFSPADLLSTVQEKLKGAIG